MDSKDTQNPTLSVDTIQITRQPVCCSSGITRTTMADRHHMSTLTPSVDTIHTTGQPVSYSLGRTRPTKADPLNMSSPTPFAATTLTTGQPACCSTETTRMADSLYMSTTRTTVSPASRSSPGK
ncbi:PREDICTED: uncharacterized protein LOC109467313 isoform X3 [Branchiostoma belcheri]|uniref:Uncharacterized protein LOC109467313 isoform X3 n=1 Tax=Branchiostoma belcheri TaxID=7741 RepID=A0A6P4YU83_BRABE|nr:PREDICTED: uncharacterized protein LOC109467313 isoform X3 [Branchiostoma belcheri]